MSLSTDGVDGIETYQGFDYVDLSAAIAWAARCSLVDGSPALPDGWEVETMEDDDA